MKKTVLVTGLLIMLTAGCGSLGDAMKASIEKEAANRKFPAGMAGSWKSDGYMKQTLDLSETTFTLKVYNRTGKETQTFSGPMRIVQNDKNFIAPAIAAMTQDGKDVSHLLKNGVQYKPMYFKDITDASVRLYIINGYSAEKNLYNHDADSKTDRNYEKFEKVK